MSHRFWAFVCILLLPSLVFCKKLYNAETFTLKNGLQCIVVQNNIAPVVNVAVVYKVGTADDPDDIRGISHFLEHIMFMGSEKFPGDLYTKNISKSGGHTNAFTAYEMTAYTTTIPSKHLDMLLEMEADRMQNLNPPREKVLSEKQVVLQERRMRMDNHPAGEAVEILYKNLFWHHPYGVLPIGYPHHIHAYTFENTMDHYAKWYHPNNAVIIIYGDMTTEKLKPMVEKHFGGFARKETPKRQRPTEPKSKKTTVTVHQNHERNALTTLSFYYHAPGYTNKKQFYALLVLEQILSGNDITPFYKHFVTNGKKALSVSASYDVSTWEYPLLDISATLTTDHDVKSLERDLKNYIQNMIKNGITIDDLKRAQRELLNGFDLIKDDFNGTINALLPVALNMPLNDIETYPQYIQNVTIEDVNAVIRDIFETAAVKMVLTPHTKIPAKSGGG